MTKINKDAIHSFNAEQISGLLLTFLREFESGQSHPSYYGGHLNSIVYFEISPIWMGKNVQNGVLIGNGYVSSYGGDKPPAELQDLFDEAVSILYKEKLVKKEVDQSAEFVKLTDLGKCIKISPSFFLRIQRRSQDIIRKYQQSVFLMETTDQKGDISCGTCFLLPDGRLLTCQHNVENRRFEIIFDEQTRLGDTNFIVQKHEQRDMSVLQFHSEMFRSLVMNKEPLQLGLSSDLEIGDALICMGYPKVAQRISEFLISEGTFQNKTKDYYGMDYVTFTNRIDGGYSGGPVINLFGEVVAVITESTEQAPGTNGQSGTGAAYFHGTPIEKANAIL
jgi:S1-C subfamily serine protease